MILSAQNITKKYNSGTHNELTVLENISIDIQDGEYLSILGSSGAGKSTLLNILASLDLPDSGDIYYLKDGENIQINSLSDSKLSKWRNSEIGFIFQFHHLLNEFTALENIYIPSLIGKKDKKHYIKRAKELIDIVGLSDRMNHRPTELSGGEQQRIAIARSLINDPKIVFADEPTGNLDKNNSEKIIELITNLQKQFNLTFVTATHSENVAKVANRTLEISASRII